MDLQYFCSRPCHSVFCFYPLWWLTYNQINNNLVSQAATMNTGGIPNEIVQNLNPFALIIGIPVFDLLIYPALRKAGINFSPIKKITAGFFVGALAMVSAAVLQQSIYNQSACGKYPSTCEVQSFVDITVWAQTPAFVLVAVSEIFASIT